MSFFRIEVSSVSRSSGRSAVAAAAYRAGEQLTDLRTGKVSDYRRRSKGVVSSEVFGTHETRAELWNRAEAAERRKDSQTAREILISLPHGLQAGLRRSLCRDFAQWLVQRYGVAVDMAIHRPGWRGSNRNHHAHLLLTTRRVLDTGELGEKVRVLDAKATRGAEVEAIRNEWARKVNAYLELAGISSRVDHRSRRRQQIDVARTPMDIGGLVTSEEWASVGKRQVDVERRRHRTAPPTVVSSRSKRRTVR
ncbi:MobQ family relaxase [Gemmatimonas sp.]|jgi:hypothetical protein|uniref:MobQ family relaxase n=1 Tax=Gemmatimonas sp. TaxID=1962908 RepID=UPI0025C54DAA|nr:MobQ family relaxase [Gemmatimonas sp.]MCA2985777.1 MobA/MobL family protein [Gemmatimonas sp.]MCA2988565.1 MobA/MobL family protein [Gemmatimonas sp.]MCA2996698.1 MobA/MobL family protein [Gemmatimonas sp.]